MLKTQATGEDLQHGSLRTHGIESLTHTRFVPTRLIGAALGSFVLANGSMLGGLSPFSLAFVASLQGPEAGAAFLGAILSYFVTGRINESIGYISAMLAVVGLRFVMSAFVLRIGNAGVSVLAGGALLVTGILSVISGDGGLLVIVMLVCEASIAGIFTYFLLESYRIFRGGRPIATLPAIEIASLCIVMVLLVAALCSLQVSVVNLGRILGVFLVLTAAERYKHLGGAVCGICIGTAAMLHTSALGASTVMLGMAGLIAGLFAKFGRFVLTALFICVNAVGLIVLGVSAETIPILVDVMLATVAYMIIPRDAVFGGESTYTGEHRSVDISELIAARLDFAASTISDIQSSVEKVAKALDKSARADPSELYTPVCDKVCRRCGLNMKCWQTEYDNSVKAFSEAMKVLRENERLDKKSLPETLSRNCCKKDELIAALNSSYKEQVSMQRTTKKLSEMRAILTEQFDSVADMLRQMSGELLQNEEYDLEAAHTVTELLAAHGMHDAKVCACVDSYGRMSIEAFGSSEPKLREEELCEQISDTLAREFDLPDFARLKNTVKITLFEKASFVLDTEVYQMPGTKGAISGDSCETFTDSRGYSYMILSDGMGSGKMAAIDSVMVCSLLTKLLRAGIGYASALKILNASLLVKSAEESFATVDLCCIDLYTGVVDLLKAGAAATFVRKGSKAAHFESTSLPIGLVGGVAFEKKQIKLGAGDVIAMVSDGVTAGSCDWIEAELELHKEMSAGELAERLSVEAKRRRVDGHEDDITVMVAKFKKGV